MSKVLEKTAEMLDGITHKILDGKMTLTPEQSERIGATVKEMNDLIAGTDTRLADLKAQRERIEAMIESDRDFRYQLVELRDAAERALDA